MKAAAAVKESTLVIEQFGVFIKEEKGAGRAILREEVTGGLGGHRRQMEAY